MADVDPDLAGPEDRPQGPTESRRDYQWDLAIAVGLGGAIGGGAREALNLAWPTPAGTFPWATFTQNVLGCFLIGMLLVLLLDLLPPTRYGRPFLATGVLGGFTTFSAYTSQTRELLADGHHLTALSYALATVVAALVATWFGMTLMRLAASRRPHLRRT